MLLQLEAPSGMPSRGPLCDKNACTRQQERRLGIQFCYASVKGRKCMAVKAFLRSGDRWDTTLKILECLCQGSWSSLGSVRASVRGLTDPQGMLKCAQFLNPDMW